MSKSCFFVAYASTATKLFTQKDLMDLLEVSRERNSAADITGLLLYRGGNFLQALEGPEDAVRATMLRIARDRRHRSITELQEGWQDGRLFDQWAMAFQEVGPSDAPPGLSTFLSGGRAAATEEGEEHDVFEFFRAFRDYLR